jgi:hypothetical protein
VVAQQKGLAVHTTAPFDNTTGPLEFTAPEGFGKVVFGLTPEEPFANPIVAPDGVYVIALARQLPSVIPPFAEISDRVKQDFQFQQAIGLAREAGTNFLNKLTSSMAAGKNFTAASVAAGQQPQVIPPFSLSTLELPQFNGRIELNQIKRVAFTTTVGHVSSFQPTADGGFVLFVEKQLSVDQSVMNAELPQFIEALRRTRENEAFNEWLNLEATRALRDTPIARQQARQ